MPPRLNKRQQRELEELEALGTVPHEVYSSSEDEIKSTFRQNTSGFAALSTLDVPDEQEDEDEEAQFQPAKARKSRKKKKKVATVDADGTSVANVTGSSSSAPQNVKGQTKKSKGKEKKSDKDDLDQALAELSVKYPHLQRVSPSSAASISSTHTLASLLSVSIQHLDSEAEMRKFFGAKVISAAKSASNTSSGPSRRQQLGIQKSHLTRPQPSWLSAKQREGLSILAYSEEDIENKMKRQNWLSVDEKWWTVEYSKRYKYVTMEFMQTVMSGDPDNFWRLLQNLPWHADTLLQLSEVYRHREEYSQAVDFVERALFTYERSFIGAFNFTSGLNRLDFDRVENRPFFLALHRQVADLQRRGCIRTAFEFARLLYSLDPWTDPHGALLHLDYVAIKSGMDQWLLDVWDLFDEWWKADQYCNRLNVTILPGWSYARALALRAREDAQKDKNHEVSDAALRDAIQAFPEIVPLLADKIDILLSSEIRRHQVFHVVAEGSPSSTSYDFLHLLSHLYAQRSFPLWKDSKRATWFSRTVTDIFPTAKWSQPRRDRFLQYYRNQYPRYSAYRHIMVLESSYRRLFAFIPGEILNSKQLACDPLPPPMTVNEYDGEFFKGADDAFAMSPRTRREAAGDRQLLERLIPDPVFRRQLQAFFEAQPDFARRFPGGIIQFVQMAGEMPEDTLEDIMIAEVMRNRDMPGAMPGGMGMFAEDIGDDDPNAAAVEGHAPEVIPTDRQAPDDAEGSDDEAGESSEEEEVAPLPLRLIRHIMNRFWGSTSGAEDTSSDEDEIDRRPR